MFLWFLMNGTLAHVRGQINKIQSENSIIQILCIDGITFIKPARSGKYSDILERQMYARGWEVKPKNSVLPHWCSYEVLPLGHGETSL